MNIKPESKDSRSMSLRLGLLLQYSFIPRIDLFDFDDRRNSPQLPPREGKTTRSRAQHSSSAIRQKVLPLGVTCGLVPPVSTREVSPVLHDIGGGERMGGGDQAFEEVLVLQWWARTIGDEDFLAREASRTAQGVLEQKGEGDEPFVPP